jgi:hypothetical protein
MFSATSALAPGTVMEDTPPLTERSDYCPFGIEQKLIAEKLCLGVDSYNESSQHLIDERLAALRDEVRKRRAEALKGGGACVLRPSGVLGHDVAETAAPP